jgi:hypothetical protein
VNTHIASLVIQHEIHQSLRVGLVADLLNGRAGLADIAARHWIRFAPRRLRCLCSRAHVKTERHDVLAVLLRSLVHHVLFNKCLVLAGVGHDVDLSAHIASTRICAGACEHSRCFIIHYMRDAVGTILVRRSRATADTRGHMHCLVCRERHRKAQCSPRVWCAIRLIVEHNLQSSKQRVRIFSGRTR